MKNIIAVKNKMKAELYLFIIWPLGRFKEQQIIEDLKKNFDVLEILEVEWSRDKTFENFCRFYRSNFHPSSIDIIRRGRGPFILVTFLDSKPVYDISLTSSGHARVNTRILKFKNKYRGWIDNEFALHSSVTLNETQHDLVLLLGQNYQDYLSEFTTQKKRKGERTKINRDLLGSDHWDSVDQIFYMLNECARYTLLRDFEASTSSLGKTSDIDLLVDDRGLKEIPYLLNSKINADDTPETFMCEAGVRNKSIPFHLHSFSYLTPKWVIDILRTRILNPYSLYVPSLENQFFSLFYQLIHWKLNTKPKYKKFLEKTYLKLFFDKSKSAEKNHFDDYLPLLNNFIHSKKYSPQVPFYVRQNPLEFLEAVRENIEELPIKNIKPYKIDLWKAGKGVKLFTGDLEFYGKVLIKYFGPEGVLKKEFSIIQFLKNKTTLKVPKPFFHKSLRYNHQMLVCEYLDASSLADNDLQTLEDHIKRKIIQGITTIIETYKTYGLIHRDIDPSNILIDKNFDVYVIDFEYMIDTKGLIFSTNEDYFHSLESLYNLGVPNNLGVLKWNDAYSVIQIIKTFEPKFESKYPELFIKLNNIAIDAEATYALDKWNLIFFRKKLKLSSLHFLKKIFKLKIWVIKKLSIQ